MKTIYRIQNAEGHGPWRGGTPQKWREKFGYHDTPHFEHWNEDRLFWLMDVEGWKCAMASVFSVCNHWAHWTMSDAIEASGYAVYVLEVEDMNYLSANSGQVIYKPEGAKVVKVMTLKELWLEFDPASAEYMD